MEENANKGQRQRAKLYVTILNTENAFESILVCDNENDLNKQLAVYANDHEQFSILSIIKGHQIDFVETKKISFLK